MTLRSIDGASVPSMTGEELMTQIGELLVDALPQVSHTDPFRRALDALACATGVGPNGLRAVD